MSPENFRNVASPCMTKTISIIIPCLNEAENLESTVANVRAALGHKFEDHEILIFDDGSTDRTGEIADAVARSDPSVQAIHNARNMGFGYTFTEGVHRARMTYVAIVPGDNEITRESLDRIFSLVGKADIVIPWTVNTDMRRWGRRILSRAFTMLMNALFRCGLKYYNGPAVHRRDLLDTIEINTRGFAFQAIALTKLIRRGHSFLEVPMHLQPKPTYRSTGLKPKNVASVLAAIVRLFRETYIRSGARPFGGINRVVVDSADTPSVAWSGAPPSKRTSRQ